MSEVESNQWGVREGYDGPGTFPKEVMGIAYEKSAALVGQEHTLYLSDGRVSSYKFQDKDTLTMKSVEGGHGHDANDVRYKAYECAPGIFLVSHAYPDHERLNTSVVLDLNRNQAVMVDGEIPAEGDDDFSVRETHIGGCIGKPANEGEILNLPFPTDLVGKRYHENYGNQYIFEMVFLTPTHIAWRCLKGNDGLVAVEEYRASQLAHDLICLSWTEEKESLAIVMLVNYSNGKIYGNMIGYNPEAKEVINIAAGGELVDSSEFGIKAKGLVNPYSDTVLQRNKDIVIRTHLEVWNQDKYELIDELYSEDYAAHFICNTEYSGRDGKRALVTGHKAAFPDWTERVVDIFAEGDRVVVRYLSTGTHLGDFQGIPATGKEVTVNEVSIYRLQNGQIIEQWGFPDALSLVQNLTGS